MDLAIVDLDFQLVSVVVLLSPMKLLLILIFKPMK